MNSKLKDVKDKVQGRFLQIKETQLKEHWTSMDCYRLERIINKLERIKRNVMEGVYSVGEWIWSYSEYHYLYKNSELHLFDIKII